MALKEQVLDLTPLGMTFTVVQAAADTAGASLDLHWELLPGCNTKSPLFHTHPNAFESYRILAGAMEVYVGNRWTVAKSGETVAIPPGVVHAFRNSTDQVVRVDNQHQPALRMEFYFEDVCRLLDKLTKGRTRRFRMTPVNLLYFSTLMQDYRPEILATSPPDFLLRPLARLGRAMGLQHERRPSLSETQGTERERALRFAARASCP